MNCKITIFVCIIFFYHSEANAKFQRNGTKPKKIEFPKEAAYAVSNAFYECAVDPKSVPCLSRIIENLQYRNDDEFKEFLFCVLVKIKFICDRTGDFDIEKAASAFPEYCEIKKLLNNASKIVGINKKEKVFLRFVYIQQNTRCVPDIAVHSKVYCQGLCTESWFGCSQSSMIPCAPNYSASGILAESFIVGFHAVTKKQVKSLIRRLRERSNTILKAVAGDSNIHVMRHLMGNLIRIRFPKEKADEIVNAAYDCADDPNAVPCYFKTIRSGLCGNNVGFNNWFCCTLKKTKYIDEKTGAFNIKENAMAFPKFCKVAEVMERCAKYVGKNFVDTCIAQYECFQTLTECDPDFLPEGM